MFILSTTNPWERVAIGFAHIANNTSSRLLLAFQDIDGDMVSVTLIVQYVSDLHMSVSLES